jgi:hypothetical protein
MVAALWLATTKGGAAQTWYHSDRLGSIRLMTNTSGGEVRDYDYQALGNLQSTSGMEYNEREFTGHIRDAETQLIYMGARYCEAPRSRAEWGTTPRWAASSRRIPSSPAWPTRKA